MKLQPPISLSVHGGILIHSSVLYWNSLHIESLIAILLSAALMALSMAGAMKRTRKENVRRQERMLRSARKERFLRTVFLVLLPLGCYYWFVIRPRSGELTSTQQEVYYALLAYQATVGVLGEMFISLLNETLGEA